MKDLKRLADSALSLAPFLVLLVLMAIFVLLDHRIVSADNLLVIVLQAIPIGLLALGLFWILLTGEVDLSAGNAVSLCTVVVGQMIAGGTGLPGAFAAGLAVCLAIGAFNGFLVGGLRLPSFIATLGTTLVIQGLTLLVSRTGIIIVFNPLMRAFGAATSSFGVPLTIPFVLLVGVCTWFVARMSSFGLKTYAAGSSPVRAGLAGISVNRQRFLVFLVASVFYFITAVVMIARVPVVSVGNGGISLLLDAIAAAVIGGTSLFGGTGTVSGVLCGALIVQLLTSALRVLGVDPSTLDLFKGMLTVAVLMSDRGFTVARVLLNNINRKA